MNAKQASRLDELNIVPACRIAILNATTGKTEVLGNVPHTPRHIGAFMAQHMAEIERKSGFSSVWVIMGGKELWKLTDNGLAARM